MIINDNATTNLNVYRIYRIGSHLKYRAQQVGLWALNVYRIYRIGSHFLKNSLQNLFRSLY